MRPYIHKISSACFYYLRRLRQLCHLVDRAMMQCLVSAFLISRLDYSNSALAGLPACALAPRQRVLHAAVRLVAGLGPHDHVRKSMKDLHWLPIANRLNFVHLCMERFSIRVRPTLENFSFRFLGCKAIHVYVLLLQYSITFLSPEHSSVVVLSRWLPLQSGTVFQSILDRFPTLDNLKER